MYGFRIEEYAVGELGANCYFLINENTGDMVIIDPGGSGSILKNKIDKEDIRPAAILLTHGHFDHAHHAALLAEEYHIPIYAHEAEKETLSDSEQNASSMFFYPEIYYADKFFKDGDVLRLAGSDINVLFTPGHTPGGACFYIKEIGVVFTGDTLFAGSVGRCDLKGGNMKDLVSSIYSKLLTLPDETQVLPGHSIRTSIGRERMTNPYLKNMRAF